ncbi:hypothetical protein FQN54_008982 [Arachnomyces sp. PD_36]|nr:hypothetical protein FQN54_008982 [Arachnomyces sp. PD_36]
MDQPFPLQSPGDLGLLRWEDVNQSALAPALNHSPIQASATSNIASLLSARSYPLSGSYISENVQNIEDLPLTDDAVPARRSPQQQTKKRTPSKSASRRHRKDQRRGSKTAASTAKECGKPGEAVQSAANEDPEERRRTQIRVAQRAYRNRQQATIKSLNNRVAHLETILENMSLTVLSFSDQLVQSGVLESYFGLTVNLRDTMKKFISLASEASADGGTHVPDETSQSAVSSQSSVSGAMTHPLPNISSPEPLDYGRLHNFTNSGFPHTLTPPANSGMDLPDFIAKLNMEALEQSYMALCNESIGMDQLRRHFGLVFSIFNREHLASYFKAVLHAQVSQKPLDGWDGVPFFRLGGAGTHHLGPSSLQGQNASLAYHRHQRCSVVEDPLSLVTADLQEQLKGEWFDLHDMEGFLRDKDVLLLLDTDEPRKGSSRNPKPIINVARLIPALLSRGVCLGRTPGFQREDVEEALQFSTIP